MKWVERKRTPRSVHDWRTRFALFPVRVAETDEGFTWAWLRFYEVRGSQNEYYIERRLPGSDQVFRIDWQPGFPGS